ncbi:MAG: acetyl-CoA carboxylase biotin carboxylase subunit [Pseudomonadota bacterium]
MTPFESVLIANRGEIACRIIRTVKSMGMRAVVVFSDADADAVHVRLADDAVHIGPALAAESYLAIDKTIEAARAEGADAIHPGYGFLSENAKFAEACAEAGLVFIGPPAEAIRIMGDKALSKARMIKAGVPCIPGYNEEDQSDAALIAAGAEIGFPLMVKAAAGGGGRGMRLVHEQAELSAAIKLARDEAQSAFGSGHLILERALQGARHVEIQVLADCHGGVIHLGERDCSVQRRHQKIIEECPAPRFDEALRAKMGESAVKAARDVDYEGAGTVEFLLDADGAFYFLEMNTRLQVEHPVTELATGFDLVAEQIRIAKGAPLAIDQKDVAFAGHAIEARLYAEDAANNFMPSSGKIDVWSPPAHTVRIDAGVGEGSSVSSYYDPMIAKLIAHGGTRDEARRRLIASLRELAVHGVVTNRAFLIATLEDENFAAGEATTAMLDDAFFEAFTARRVTGLEAASRAASMTLFLQERADAAIEARANPSGLVDWSSASPIGFPYVIEAEYGAREISVTATGKGAYRVHDDDGEVYAVRVLKFAPPRVILEVNGARISCDFHIGGEPGARSAISIFTDGVDFHFVNGARKAAGAAGAGATAGAVTAPMHGALVEVAASVGAEVSAGDRLGVLEAMKMQHPLKAGVAGVVSAVRFAPGDQVDRDAVIFEIEPSGA